MLTKELLLVVLLLCCFFNGVYPTFNLLNALTKGVHHTKCKLHKIGSKIIQHDHKHGDPCEEHGPGHQEHHGDPNFENLPQGYGGQSDNGPNGNELQHLNGHSHDHFSGTTGYEEEHLEHFNGNRGVYGPEGASSQNVFESNGNKYIEGPGFVRPGNFGTAGSSAGNTGQTFGQSSGNFGGSSTTTTGPDEHDNALGKENIELGTVDNTIDDKGYSGKPKTTTELFSSNLDIDIRLGQEDPTTRKYLPVPEGGGRNNIKAPCKDNTKATSDGCMESL